MTLRKKVWLLVGLGAAAGIVESFWDNPHAHAFAYLRNAVLAALPSVVAARFLKNDR